LSDAFYVDWSRTYAYGSLGDTAMATTNMKCAANTYADLSEDFVPDYVFEQDNDFYLQSISAAQEFYLSLIDMRLGFLNMITFGIAGFLRNAAILIFPIVTLILQGDTVTIAPIKNDTRQPDDPAKKIDPKNPVKPVVPADPKKPNN
jgi:hypothetical protein